MERVGLIETEVAGQLWDYWEELRPAGDAMPARAAFLPQRVPESLPYTMLTEAQSAAWETVRLMGTAIDALMPTRDRTFDSASRIDAALRGLYQGLCAVRAERPVVTLRKSRLLMNDGRRLGFEILHLPLRAPAPGTTPVLACLAPYRAPPPGLRFDHGPDYERVDALWLHGLDHPLGWSDLPAPMVAYLVDARVPVHFARVDTAVDPAAVPGRRGSALARSA
ncbi:hypothetical protein CCR85_10965 [Rhodothalassium salexigens]|nr:PAS domain-containing protein [Rhodothalassium salexigens]MBK5912009.1 hypothetical protein [Rhodothalassium salexigens]MBK5922167.1 hypothetical protein [Rhodothalassium salexigens]